MAMWVGVKVLLAGCACMRICTCAGTSRGNRTMQGQQLYHCGKEVAGMCWAQRRAELVYRGEAGLRRFWNARGCFFSDGSDSFGQSWSDSGESGSSTWWWTGDGLAKHQDKRVPLSGWHILREDKGGQVHGGGGGEEGRHTPGSQQGLRYVEARASF